MLCYDDGVCCGTLRELRIAAALGDELFVRACPQLSRPYLIDRSLPIIRQHPCCAPSGGKLPYRPAIVLPHRTNPSAPQYLVRPIPMRRCNQGTLLPKSHPPHSAKKTIQSITYFVCAGGQGKEGPRTDTRPRLPNRHRRPSRRAGFRVRIRRRRCDRRTLRGRPASWCRP